MMRRIAEFEAAGLDALVDEMQGVLLAIADGAEDLTAAARGREARFAGVGLGQGHLSLGRSPLAHTPGRRVEQRSRRVHVANEISARVLDGLIAPDRPPALHARLRVLDGQLDDALRAADHL